MFSVMNHFVPEPLASKVLPSQNEIRDLTHAGISTTQQEQLAAMRLSIQSTSRTINKRLAAIHVATWFNMSGMQPDPEVLAASKELASVLEKYIPAFESSYAAALYGTKPVFLRTVPTFPWCTFSLPNSSAAPRSTESSSDDGPATNPLGALRNTHTSRETFALGPWMEHIMMRQCAASCYHLIALHTCLDDDYMQWMKKAFESMRVANRLASVSYRLHVAKVAVDRARTMNAKRNDVTSLQDIVPKDLCSRWYTIRKHAVMITAKYRMIAKASAEALVSYDTLKQIEAKSKTATPDKPLAEYFHGAICLAGTSMNVPVFAGFYAIHKKYKAMITDHEAMLASIGMFATGNVAPYQGIVSAATAQMTHQYYYFLALSLHTGWRCCMIARTMSVADGCVPEQLLYASGRTLGVIEIILESKKNEAKLPDSYLPSASLVQKLEHVKKTLQTNAENMYESAKPTSVTELKTLGLL